MKFHYVFFSYYLRGLGQKQSHLKFLWVPELGPRQGGGGVFLKKDVLPLRLPLEIRNHDSSHLVKSIDFERRDGLESKRIDF